MHKRVWTWAGIGLALAAGSAAWSCGGGGVNALPDGGTSADLGGQGEGGPAPDRATDGAPAPSGSGTSSPAAPSGSSGTNGSSGTSNGSSGTSDGSSGTSGAIGADSGARSGASPGGGTRADAAAGAAPAPVSIPIVNGDGGTGCPPPANADAAYARWPMPNPASLGLPNPSSYTDNGDGTVLDNVTGLVWQKAVAASQAFAWADAKTYCTGLTLAGRTWRLPSRIELTSLIDFTKNPGIDATAFPGTPGGKFHWTATPWVVSQIATKPQDAWIVNFSDSGLTSNGAAQTATEFARCVSSAPLGPLPAPLYVQVAAGEVEDTQTKLVWVQATNMTAMSQTDAAAYCTGLGLNGHAWRLPSIKELATLVDDNPNIAKVSPAIDACTFADTPANAWYMSSSSVGTAAWALNYEDGFTNHSQTTGIVRCVR